MGYISRNMIFKTSKTVFIVAFVFLLINAAYVKIDVVGCVWGYWGAFPIMTLAGVLLVYNLVRFYAVKSNAIMRCLSYLGRNSIWILVFHFVGFHLLSSIMVSIGIGDSDSLGCITVLHGINNYVWFIPYSIAGVSFSILYPIIKSIVR